MCIRDRPYVVLIGNHDCLGTGAETYKAVFGPTNFSFIAGNVKFICLNTNALEYDYSEPVPNFTFMEQELTNRQDEFKKTVISMHARPYTDVFNDNVAKVFQHYVKQYPGIDVYKRQFFASLFHFNQAMSSHLSCVIWYITSHVFLIYDLWIMIYVIDVCAFGRFQKLRQSYNI